MQRKALPNPTMVFYQLDPLEQKNTKIVFRKRMWNRLQNGALK